MLSMLRATDDSRLTIVVRVIGGVPLFAIGLVHAFGTSAPMQPIVEAMGLPFAGVLAPLAVVAEIVAGASILLGLWARAGGLLTVGVMAVAFAAHLLIPVWPAGNNQPPFALPLVILACGAYVAWRGAGRWSLDARG